MLNEFDSVVLIHDIAEHGLREGDSGAIVHCYPGGEAFEVEFFTPEGITIDVLTVTTDDIRPASEQELRCARPGIVATA
jgi:hypothetical protein